jgi:hypothetical protein
VISIVEAIMALNPSVVTVRELEAFDKDDNPVVIDLDAAQALFDSTQYQRDRAAEYPSVNDYLDGIVKGDQAQIDAYIAACQAVKAKYPKPE